ncbi:24907_t:CDS:2 [Entrophospora sp. SA101]|nr:24907_t:CDS:2 [Entrophospora sp. SA101]
MSNLSFDREKKRQMILENFNNPTQEISLAKLQEISNSLNVPFRTFFSLNTSCGDTIHLLIQQKNNLVKLARFAIKTEIGNIEKMLQGQKYQLNNCPQMAVFGSNRAC